MTSLFPVNKEKETSTEIEKGGKTAKIETVQKRSKVAFVGNLVNNTGKHDVAQGVFEFRGCGLCWCDLQPGADF